MDVKPFVVPGQLLFDDCGKPVLVCVSITHATLTGKPPLQLHGWDVLWWSLGLGRLLGMCWYPEDFTWE